MVSTALHRSRHPGQPTDYRALCRIVSEGTAWAVGAIALGLLFTWQSNLIPSMGSAGPMSIKTLTCLFLASCSLLLFQRGAHDGRAHQAGAVLGLGIAVTGLIVIAQLMWVNEPYGTVLKERNALEGVVVQGRMALTTCLIFLTLGVALVGLHRDWRPILVEPAAIFAGALAMLGEIGNAYQVHELLSPVAIGGMGPSAALLLGALTLGVAIARPDSGLLSLYTSPGAGGVAARSLIAPVLLVPFALGWLSLAGMRMALYGRAMAFALVAVCTTAAFGALVTGLAQRLWNMETRLAELQQEVVQAQRVDVAGYMAGWIAHEFNNLLTVLQGNAQIAIETPHLPGAARESLAEVVAACEEATTLSKKLLRFSGHEVVSTASVDLVKVLAEMKPTLASVVGPRVHVVVATRCEAALIRANRTRIDYILMQLTLNARDAMPDGGRLDIELSCQGPNLRLQMRDTGQGMPPDVRERVFEPFVTTKPRVRGTGLGIPTVYGIIKQLRGTIELPIASPGHDDSRLTPAR